MYYTYGSGHLPDLDTAVWNAYRTEDPMDF